MPGGGKGGGSSTSTVNVNNGPISVDSDSTVEVKGLDNINVTAKIPEPIVTASRLDTNSDITTKSDVNSDSKNALSVDLKPVVLDVCSTTSTKLPHGEISQPFNFHVGLTWFGTEFLGFNFGGESRTILRDLPKRPSIDWAAQENSASHATSAEPRDVTSPASARGLRIRIK
jgi:hypothetical protein